MTNQPSAFSSVFVVKQNINWFACPVFLVAFCACHPRHPERHWVVMKIAIESVSVFILVYSWSQKNIIFVVLTCGKTIRHCKAYLSQFTGAFDSTEAKELPQPVIAHQMYHFLLLINELNKECQNALAFKISWLTENCWTKLVILLTGENVVNLMRWTCNRQSGMPSGY